MSPLNIRSQGFSFYHTLHQQISRSHKLKNHDINNVTKIGSIYMTFDSFFIAPHKQKSQISCFFLSYTCYPLVQYQSSQFSCQPASFVCLVLFKKSKDDNKDISRIVGGTFVTPGTYLWFTSLRYTTNKGAERARGCGRMLVSPEWVLTAGVHLYSEGYALTWRCKSRRI